MASYQDAIETVQFTAEEIAAITTTCKQMGNKHSMESLAMLSSKADESAATAHAYTDASVLHAIENGVRGIEHGNLIGATTAKL